MKSRKTLLKETVKNIDRAIVVQNKILYKYQQMKELIEKELKTI